MSLINLTLPSDVTPDQPAMESAIIPESMINPFEMDPMTELARVVLSLETLSHLQEALAADELTVDFQAYLRTNVALAGIADNKGALTQVATEGVKEVLKTVWDKIGAFFKWLGGKLMFWKKKNSDYLNDAQGEKARLDAFEKKFVDDAEAWQKSQGLNDDDDVPANGKSGTAKLVVGTEGSHPWVAEQIKAAGVKVYAAKYAIEWSNKVVAIMPALLKTVSAGTPQIMQLYATLKELQTLSDPAQVKAKITEGTKLLTVMDEVSETQGMEECISDFANLSWVNADIQNHRITLKQEGLDTLDKMGANQTVASYLKEARANLHAFEQRQGVLNEFMTIADRAGKIAFGVTADKIQNMDDPEKLRMMSDFIRMLQPQFNVFSRRVALLMDLIAIDMQISRPYFALSRDLIAKLES